MKRLLSMHWTFHFAVAHFVMAICAWAYPVFHGNNPPHLVYVVVLNYCFGCLGYLLWKDIKKQYRDEVQFLED